MMRIASGRDVDGRGELRIAPGEVEHELAIPYNQIDRDPAGIAADAVLVDVVGEEILAPRDPADDVARLLLAVVEEVLDALTEDVGAEALDHLVHLALARLHRGDLGLEVAPVLLAHADVEQHDVEHILVELAATIELHRREPDAFLMHLDVGA